MPAVVETQANHIKPADLSGVLDTMQNVADFSTKLTQILPFCDDESLEAVYPLFKAVGDKSFYARCFIFAILTERRKLRETIDEWQARTDDSLGESTARAMSSIWNRVNPGWRQWYDETEVDRVLTGKKKWVEAKIVKDGFVNGFDLYPQLTNGHYWVLLHVPEPDCRSMLMLANDSSWTPAEFRQYVEEKYKSKKQTKEAQKLAAAKKTTSATSSFWEYAFTGEPETDISNAMPDEIPDGISEIGYWLGIAVAYFNHCIESGENLALLKVSRLIGSAIAEFTNELTKDEAFTGVVATEDSQEDFIDVPGLEIETVTEEEAESDSMEAQIMREMESAPQTPDAKRISPGQ